MGFNDHQRLVQSTLRNKYSIYRLTPTMGTYSPYLIPMKCLTTTCRRFIPANNFRCEPCADKLAEKIHSDKAEKARLTQLQDFEEIYTGYIPPTPHSNRSTARQSFSLFSFLKGCLP
jgi:hypothetical protein